MLFLIQLFEKLKWRMREMKKDDNHREKEIALYEALAFFQEDLGFSNYDIANVLRLPMRIVNNWLGSKRIILNRKAYTPNQLAVIDLIAIHKSLLSMFSKKENRLAWLNAIHHTLGKRPWDIMKEPHGLHIIKTYLDTVIDRGA